MKHALRATSAKALTYCPALRGPATAALVALALGPVAVFAQSDPMSEARAAARALEYAAQTLAAAEGARNRVAALTETIRAYEAGLAAMRDGLRGATIRERTIQLEFDQRRDQLSQLLGVLQTIERASAPLLLIHPTGPVGTARSGMMMSEVTPALQAQATELRAQLDELAEIRRLQEDAEMALRLGLAGVQEARVALSQAVADRTDLPLRLADDPVRVQILADSATSLTAFAGSIGILPPEAQSTAPIPFAARRGTLALPVEGTLLRRFNEVDAAGLARPGLLVAARPL
ncbi:MAG: peptidase M23, partial [Pseudomonadota bacterium]